MSIFNKIIPKEVIPHLLTTTVLVSALGYFVDIYDLILFGIVRVASLTELGITGAANTENGVYLLNMQMGGMLIGGIIWGILGDKKGRLSVLFGSIFLYSVGNLLNAFVTTVDQYAWLRFFSGVGLAGELGAAVTLISEVMPKEVRGYGTAVVAGIGVSGAIFAAIIGDFFHWRTAYIVGGVLGFILLILRIRMYESGLFEAVKSSPVGKGKFFSLFTSADRFSRFVKSIAIGLPIWFTVGVLITFSPEFGKQLGVQGPVSAGKSIMFTYIGLIFGDLLSGFLSQILKSRKKVVLYFIVSTFSFILVYLFSHGLPLWLFYALCIAIGISIGYWAVFVTIASEQFGTNLRATVTTTVPNFIRGMVVPIAFGYKALVPSLGMIYAALVTGVICIAFALIALNNLSESFGRNLDFFEDI